MYLKKKKKKSPNIAKFPLQGGGAKLPPFENHWSNQLFLYLTG